MHSNVQSMRSGVCIIGDAQGVMKPMPQLDQLLQKAKAKNMFGTKMRSVIKEANEEGIKAIVAQQFEVGKQIWTAGLCPILKPEVDIKSADKEKIESMLKAKLLSQLDALDENISSAMLPLGYYAFFTALFGNNGWFFVTGSSGFVPPVPLSCPRIYLLGVSRYWYCFHHASEPHLKGVPVVTATWPGFLFQIFQRACEGQMKVSLSNLPLDPPLQ